MKVIAKAAEGQERPGHKYLRREKKGSRWHYVYKEGHGPKGGEPKSIEERRRAAHQYDKEHGKTPAEEGELAAKKENAQVKNKTSSARERMEKERTMADRIINAVGLRKPSSWGELHSSGETEISPKERKWLQSLQVVPYEGGPMDAIENRPANIFIAENRGQYYLVDTQGRAYARYAAWIRDFQPKGVQLKGEAKTPALLQVKSGTQFVHMERDVNIGGKKYPVYRNPSTGRLLAYDRSAKKLLAIPPDRELGLRKAFHAVDEDVKTGEKGMDEHGNYPAEYFKTETTTDSDKHISEYEDEDLSGYGLIHKMRAIDEDKHGMPKDQYDSMKAEIKKYGLEVPSDIRIQEPENDKEAPDAMIEKIIKMHKKGMTPEQIRNELGTGDKGTAGVGDDEAENFMTSARNHLGGYGFFGSLPEDKPRQALAMMKTFVSTLRKRGWNNQKIVAFGDSNIGRYLADSLSGHNESDWPKMIDESVTSKRSGNPEENILHWLQDDPEWKQRVKDATTELERTLKGK